MSRMRGLSCLAAVFFALPVIGCGEESTTSPDIGLDAEALGPADAEAPGLDAGARDAAELGTDTGPQTRPDAATPADGGTGGTDCTLNGNECGAGKACRLNEDWNLVCGTAGNVALGQPCTTSPDNCAAGLACQDMNGSGDVCWTLCSSDPLVTCPNPTKQVCVSYSEATGGICVGDDCTPGVGNAGTGCPDGKQCDVFAGKAYACVATGPAATGATCEVDWCQAGNHCVYETSGYTCAAYCTPSQACTQEGAFCQYPWYDKGIEIGVCLEGECDPVSSAGCDADEGWYYLDPEEGTFSCWPGGRLLEGADCSSMLELCAPGHDCFAVDGTGPNFEYRCFQYCDDAHPTCSGSKTCTASDRVVGVKLCK
ncbi:MAG: hypothetical protein HY901_33425 [Deltaproteobacteria bacterium]|nr:hypothetical protein [Deltaproteobacteria bacterium]